MRKRYRIMSAESTLSMFHLQYAVPDFLFSFSSGITPKIYKLPDQRINRCNCYFSLSANCSEYSKENLPLSALRFMLINTQNVPYTKAVPCSTCCSTSRLHLCVYLVNVVAKMLV